MGARSLTSKQRRFAELLASGCTKVDAFRQAYPSGQRTKGTEWEGAKRVARHPAVAAEVQRLTLLRSPHDAAIQAEHVSARLLELSKSSEPSIALRAIAQWGKLAEAGLLKSPTTSAKQSDAADRPIETARIIEELRGLYQEALGPDWQHRNELVASSNAGGTDGQSEHYAAPLNSPTDAASEPFPLEVQIDSAPDSLQSPGDAELVAIPGWFPPRFRRVQGS
jgi:hypothetical protein